MRVGAAVAALVLLALTINRAQGQGVSIHMHSGEGYAADGILFEPAIDRPPFPAILLIPDERGVIQRVTDLAEQLAAAGYFVAVVDLNRGQAPDVTRHSTAQAMHDLNAALGFLGKQSRVRHDCLGALGWRSGGLYALELAVADPKICTVVMREPTRPDASLNLSRMHAHVLATIAGSDPTTSHGTGAGFAKLISDLGHGSELKTYPQAAIGFDDPQDSAHFRSVDAEDLRSRTLSFLKEHLADQR